MADGPVSCNFNQDSYVKLMSYLTAIGEVSLSEATAALNEVTEMYRSEVKRHMPRDEGLAANSVGIIPAEYHRVLIRSSVGSNVPYVPYLEFGADKARGLLKALTLWKDGDQPILRWYAKDKDLLEVMRKRDKSRSGQAIARYNKILTAQDTPSEAEFAPPFRGSWQIIAPRAIDRVRMRLAKTLRDAFTR